MSKDPKVVLKMTLSAAQALALAQFVKRVGWSEIRANATDEFEAHLMLEAVNLVQRELAAKGYAPR